MKETYGPCEGKAEQHLLQQCFQLVGWLRTVLLSVVVGDEFLEFFSASLLFILVVSRYT